MYELLGKCINDQQWLPRKKLFDTHRVINAKAITNVEPDCEPLASSCDLYARVNKISSGPNLKQDFVSIYDLTDVPFNVNPA